MDCLNQTKLTPLMKLTGGKPEITVGVIDGPVEMTHPGFVGSHLRQLDGAVGACQQNGSVACQHGTFVAGILAASRSSTTPGICPGCTLLIRPIFAEAISQATDMPSATAAELATAILQCVEDGARILNISAAITRPSTQSERALEDALNLAAKRGALVVCAAGNQGQLGSTAITRHPWVIPVIAVNRQGQPMNLSNLGSSIGKRGLAAPGEQVTSLGSAGKTLTSAGTSAAAPFVAGTVALLWSMFPNATAAEIKYATLQANGARRNSVAPPLLDAAASYQFLQTHHSGR